MQSVDTIINAKWVLPIAPHNCVLQNHSVVIHDGVILECLPTKDCASKYLCDNTRHLMAHIVMPGLINNHTHSPMNLFRGLADDIPLMTWLQEHMWPAESAVIDNDNTETGCALAIAEMIRGGTTCFNDHYLFPQAIAKASATIGMRSAVGLLVTKIANQYAQGEQETLQMASQALEAGPPSSLVNWTLAPHSPYSLSDRAFEEIRNLSQRYNAPVHIHLHETGGEVTQSINEFGCRPIERLRRLGLINSKLIAVHCVHLTDEEIELLHECDSHVVHSPQSNLKLGSGIAPMSQLYERGVNITIGTDGAASNNDLDMFSEMQTASLLAKGASQNPATLKAQHVLEMCTINAARSLGIDTKVGSIEAGKEADLIAIKTDDYWQTPIFNPFAHLVYSTNRLSVTDTWVRGKALMENQKLMTIDVDSLMSKARPLLEKIKPFMYQN